ncbi:hypothetical protein ACJ41O_006884 [Fusarium nematophilum]
MKASFFSIFALAMTAIASPMAQPANAPRDGVNGADKASAGPGKRAAKVTDVNQLITLLKGADGSLDGQAGGIGSILDQVKAGDITKNEGADQAVPIFEDMHFTLTEVVTSLTGAAGLDVADSDVDTVLNLVVVLVTIVLTTVKTLVTVLGLRPQLISVLHSVFQILAKVLVLVIGLVVAIVPGLVAALSPLLAGLGNGLLVPIVTPLAGLLAGLAA